MNIAGRCPSVRIALFLIVVLSPITAVAAPEFMGLGIMPAVGTDGGYVFSYASDASWDGSVVVGTTGEHRVYAGRNRYTGQNRWQAFRWTATGGMVGLGDLPAWKFESEAQAVSPDGLAVVGTGETGVRRSSAFLWMEKHGMLDLGVRAGPGWNWRGTYGQGVSACGEVTVGAASAYWQPGYGAFTWTQSSFMVDLGILPGASTQNALLNAITPDGSVAVGKGTDSNGQIVALRWTAADGMVGLGQLPSGAASVAHGVSGDGSVIVGSASDATGGYAVRWNTEEGIINLGELPGGNTYGTATAVSYDGSRIVGYAYNDAGKQAVIWDGANPIRELDAYLTDLGLTLTGWTLTHAYGISDDGSTIVGEGINPAGEREAWVARLAEATVPKLDIRPESAVNFVIPGSQTVIPVVIYGSDRFEAWQLNRDSLRFGPGGAEMVWEEDPIIDDYDGDGIADILAHFRVADAGFDSSDCMACIEGLVEGVPFSTCDSLYTVPTLVYSGYATGGSVRFEIEGQTLEVETVEGQSAQEVAESTAEAINDHPVLQAMEVAATADGAGVVAEGAILDVVILDAGLNPETVMVPSTSLWMLGPLSLLLVLSALPLIGLRGNRVR